MKSLKVRDNFIILYVLALHAYHRCYDVVLVHIILLISAQGITCSFICMTLYLVYKEVNTMFLVGEKKAKHKTKRCKANYMRLHSFTAAQIAQVTTTTPINCCRHHYYSIIYLVHGPIAGKKRSLK